MFPPQPRAVDILTTFKAHAVLIRVKLNGPQGSIVDMQHLQKETRFTLIFL